jgi:undecaprenyl-diphosphatase
MSLQRLLALDTRLSMRMRVAEQKGPLRNLAVILAHSGDSWFWLLGLVGVFYWGSAYWKVRALVLAAGVVFTAVLVMGIKFTVRRRRPAGEWGDIYRKTDPHSFPSGHAARAIMLAVIALWLGPLWLALLLFLWAPLVSLARVAMGVHYVLDVLAGTVLGVLMGGITIWLLGVW